MSSAICVDLDTLRELVTAAKEYIGSAEGQDGGEQAAYQGRVDQARRAIQWAADTFGDQFTVASSMGDVVLVHLVGQVAPGTDVFFIDTGLHFPETIGTRDAYESQGQVRIRTVLPLLTVREQEVLHGPDLWERDPDRCCAMRKVEPLERALVGRLAWATGMRRDDAPTRTDIDVVTWDARRSLIKLNPLAAWTALDVARYTQAHAVLENPLLQLGYPSIGCQPCTRPVAAGADPRSGRWAGRAKTECGLHT